MSIKAMTWAWGQGVEARTKLVLMALADHADDDGICWPGLKGVAKKNRISHRAVQRHLALLEQAGLLVITPQFRPDGSQTANLYTLALTVKAPSHAKTTHGDDSIVRDDTGGGGGMTRATPLEPPLEPPFSGGHPQTPVPPPPPDGDTSAYHLVVYHRRSHRTPQGPVALPPGVGNGVLSSPNSKKSRKSPKPPDPLHPEVKLVFEGLKARRTFQSPAAAAEASAIRWMLKQGYPSGEQLACYDYLKSQSFWGDKPVLMPSVKTQIGEWKKNGKTERANEGNTSRSAPSAIPGQRPGGAFDDID